MMALAGGLRLEQHLCTSLQGTSLCPRFQSGHLTAENEIKSFLKPLPGQVQSSCLEGIDGVVTLALLPDLPTVKHHKGCRLNVVGAMGKERISERSERETIALFPH